MDRRARRLQSLQLLSSKQDPRWASETSELVGTWPLAWTLEASIGDSRVAKPASFFLSLDSEKEAMLAGPIWHVFTLPVNPFF